MVTLEHNSKYTSAPYIELKIMMPRPKFDFQMYVYVFRFQAGRSLRVWLLPVTVVPLRYVYSMTELAKRVVIWHITLLDSSVKLELLLLFSERLLLYSWMAILDWLEYISESGPICCAETCTQA